MSIAALKKVGRGTRILLMDRNGGLSKAVAKDLDRRGFKKARMLAGTLPHARPADWSACCTRRGHMLAC